MSRLHDNGASYMAEQAYDWYKKEVSALEQANKVVAQGFFANKSVNRQRAKAAKQVQYALKSAEKSFGPQGYNNAALVDWAQQWAQEQAADKAEIARKQAEFDTINSLFNAAIGSPESSYTRRSETVRCEEPNLPRHVRTYFVDVDAEQVQIGDNAIERVAITDGYTSIKITGQIDAGSAVVSFEASPSTGFVGRRSVADSGVATIVDFATFNEQYASQLQPASV